MPSLKDLKNKITSIKNTRKITKAMQMVCRGEASPGAGSCRSWPPLCRADECGDGGACSIGWHIVRGAPRLLAGTGADKVHLLVVMTAERGLCGGFNSTIVRLARSHAHETVGQRQDGEDSDRWQKRPRTVEARSVAELLIGHVDLSDVKRVGYDQAQRSRTRYPVAL